MRITQARFRTVRLVAGGLTVLLRYSLYQDGDERLPESIACRGDQVPPYFLASTIRDFIAPERHGLSIQRSWTVLQEGRVGLSFCLEFPELTGAAWLLAGGARGGAGPPRAGEAAPRGRGAPPPPPRAGPVPGRKPAQRGQAALQAQAALRVSGSLEQAARLNLVISPARELFAQGLSAAP